MRGSGLEVQEQRRTHEADRNSSGFVAALRLDLAESLRSRWALLCLIIYAGIGAVFVLVGMRESALLGFTGTSRVLLGTTHFLLLVIPLLALLATAQVVNRAREDGALELWLSQPIGRTEYLLAVALSRYVVLTTPFVLALLIFGVLLGAAGGAPVAWELLLRAAAIGAALNAAFVGLGLALSTWLDAPAKSATAAIFLWMLSVALLDFALVGAMLQWRLQPQAIFALAVINPVQAARMALLSAQDPELSVLGPVGFYLVHQVGARTVLALGTLWPACVAALALGVSWLRIRSRDVC
jgi:ABC-2 type transport system permease protein